MYKLKQICLAFIISVVGFGNSLWAAVPTYPIQPVVYTTLDMTVVPVPVPSSAPRLLPNDVSKFAKYGYGVWKYGGGLGFQKYLNLMPRSYKYPSINNTTTLLRFFTMSDVHLTDIQSPAQTIFTGLTSGGNQSGYSSAIPYTTQVLDAAVQTVNTLHKKKVFDFGLFLGDAINNNQYNELRWYVDILDGKYINPNSNPGLFGSTDYLRPFQAAGLNKSIRWYQVMGNHDHFWTGCYTASNLIKQTIIGKFILNLGKAIPGIGNNYAGIIDGKTPDGKVINAGPLPTPPETNANTKRHSLTKQEWISQFFNTTSTPAGHGFSRDSIKTGFSCYSFIPKSNLPLKVIVLDDTQRNDTVFQNGADGAQGALDQQRYQWLIKELNQGQSQGYLMIIAAHVPIQTNTPNLWDPKSSPTEAQLIAKLHTYSNLILWLSGHRHLNTITALPSPDPLHPEFGFWEVETASLRDWCQQFRIFDINFNSDKTLSIFTTDVDPSVAKNSPAAKSRSYSIANAEIFNPPGTPFHTSYNAELVKPINKEMQRKLSVLKSNFIGNFGNNQKN